MKLIRCYVENFGKLSNFEYQFKDGLNVINEENGFGKTTFANFIKVMFYGLNSKKTNKVLTERKKYDPWQGGKYGGNLEFEINNKRYKIERFFGAKDSEDTFKLYDLATNLESYDYTQNIGEEIFGLNREAYERSTYISGQNMETSMNDSLNAKLGNLLESENDINSSDKAISILDNAIKVYKKSGGKGELYEKIHRKTELEQKIEQSKTDEIASNERRKKIEQINTEIQKNKEQVENYQKRITNIMEQETIDAKEKNYQMLANNLKETEDSLNSMKEFFNNDIPTDEYIEDLTQDCVLLEKYKLEVKNCDIPILDKENISELNKVFSDKNINEEFINNKISECNEIKDIDKDVEYNQMEQENLEKETAISEKDVKVNRTIGLAIMLIALILLMAGITIGFLKANIKVGVAIGIVAIIILIVAIIKNQKAKKMEEELLDKKRKIEQIKETIDAFRKKKQNLQISIKNFIDEYYMEKDDKDDIILLSDIKTRFIKYKDLKNNLNSALEKQYVANSKLNGLNLKIKNSLRKYFGEVVEPYSEYAQELRMRKNEYDRLEQEYKQRLELKEDFAQKNNIQEIEQIKEQVKNETLNREQLEELLKQKEEEIQKLNDEKNYNKNQLEILESKLDGNFEIENEIDSLKQEIEEMQKKCTILEKTKQYLETAKAKFSSRYLGGMKTEFINNLKLINGEEINASVDINLDVKITQNGEEKQIEYLSTGYTDLINICMRFSLVQALFENENPFVILDDPFVNLDEKKLERSIQLLKELSNKYQIIYFICHNSRNIRDN